MSMEVTDEMIDAVWDVKDRAGRGADRDQIRHEVRAVLEIVEREYKISPVECGAPMYPDDEDFAYKKCEHAPGHDGRHGRYIENDGWESWA